jgi:uncharacterized membrane protein YphA (DoxX/SURF4 family)
MNIALWIAQGVLAVMYLTAGQSKVFRTAKAKEQLSWAKHHSDGFVRFVGTAELLGAIGLILPMVTGILPWLTVLAAVGLALIQLLAMFTEHVPKKEFKMIPVNLVLLALALFVLVERWSLFS